MNNKTGLPLLFAAVIASAALALEVAAKPTNQGNSQGNGSQTNNGNGQGNNGNGQGNNGNGQGNGGQSNNGNGQGNTGNGQGNGGQGNNGNGQGGGSQGNGGSGVGSPALAQPPASCSAPGPHPWNLAVGNVTIGATAANDCWGVVTKDNWSKQKDPFGNDSAGTINLNALFESNDWTFVVRDSSGSGPPPPGSFGGVTWTLTGNGTWSLQTSDPPPAEIEVDFIAVLKGSDSWAGWFFDDFLFSVPSTTGGSWTIAWDSNGGQTAGFSHMSLYMRDARIPTPPTNTACTGLACSNNVPEPGTLALLAFGACGIGALRRRGKLPEPKRVGG